MNDIWVCADCRSINRMRDDVCYRCRSSRSGALETPSLDLRSESAVYERSARSYVISWPLAGIAAVLIVAVAILGLVVLKLQVAEYPAMRQNVIDSMTGGQTAVENSLVVQSVQIAVLSLLRLGLALLALVCFAGWLALVARNVPLLGGGVPSRSPLRIFIYTLIPIWNLIKVPGIVQDLLYRVDPREGGAFMVMAAWIGLVGSWLVSVIGSWMITVLGVRALVPAIAANDTQAVVKTIGDVLDRSYWLGVAVEVMIAVGAILLVMTMVRVESRCAARDSEIRERMAERPAGLAGPPVGPNWDGDAANSADTPIPLAGVALAAAGGAEVAGTITMATAPAPVAPVQPAAATTAPVAPAAATTAPMTSAGAPAASPAAYEPNWPTSRGWLGRPSSAASADQPATDDAPPAPPSPAADPSASPAPTPAEPSSPPPALPPPPPPGAPNLG